MCFPVLAGRHTGEFLKLAHEMQFAVVSAEECQRGDGHIGDAEIKLGLLDPCVNHILNAGSAEKLFI